MGLEAALGQHDVVLPPPLIQRDKMKGVLGPTTVLQLKPELQMLPQADAMGPPSFY